MPKAKTPQKKPKAKTPKAKAKAAKPKAQTSTIKKNGSDSTPNASAQKAPKIIVQKPAPPKTQSGSAKKSVANILGEIVWLMGQSEHYSSVTMGEIKTRILPAVLRGQFRVFYAKERLIGAILWAFVSNDIEPRLAEGNNQLKDDEWTSGEFVWIVEFVAPFGAEGAMVEDLKETTFKGKPVKYRGQKDGKPAIFTF